MIEPYERGVAAFRGGTAMLVVVQPETVPPPPPPPPKRARSKRTIALIVAASVGVLLVGGVIVWRWWTNTPWAELRAALNSFPVPAEFSNEGVTVSGDRPAICDIKMGCEDPRGGVGGTTELDGPGACTAMADALAQWHGATVTSAPTYDPDIPCVWDVTINGMDGQASVLYKPSYGPTAWGVVLFA